MGEPLYQDVVTTLAEAVATGRADMPQVIGGRYGLASKEFTPAMAKAVLDELNEPEPKRRFTVGIVDDVSSFEPRHDPSFTTTTAITRAVFFGLGSDGTVSANKSIVKIIGEQADLEAQGYFVYDSKKSGSTTVSHLRFSTRPIRSTISGGAGRLRRVHQFGLLERMDVLGVADRGATLLLNSPYGPDELWERCRPRCNNRSSTSRSACS